ncbi:MAG: tRNA lysidine(34) synthetase TilS [Desulfobulbaceae bacterium]|nr:tRNA lysidine(34) synthetase TilS [Desulfobulbaceae bacterium]
MNIDKKISHPIVLQVKNTIAENKLFSPTERIVLGVSGGSDSLGLLYIFAQLTVPENIYAIYADHGLRPDETRKEKNYIKQLCHSLGVHFEHIIINVKQLAANEHRSIEDAARILRYKGLEKIRQKHKAAVIGVGHTADDQVEEFFIRFIRGSGIKGLSGMALKRGKIVRPLLFHRKAEIEAYLSQQKINWCFDSSNNDRTFLRNRVRLDLLPLLEKNFNPAIRTKSLQTMDILRADDNYIEIATKSSYSKCVSELHFDSVDENGGNRGELQIQLNIFLNEHLSVQRRILEKCCWKIGVRPSYEHIQRLIHFFQYGKSGGELHLEDGVRVKKEPVLIYFTRVLKGQDNRGSDGTICKYSEYIQEPGAITLKTIGRKITFTKITNEGLANMSEQGGKVLLLDADKLSFPLQIRPPEDGERFQPYNSTGSKKINRYFNEKKIHPDQRKGWPVIVSRGQIVALAGLQITHHYRVTNVTTNILTLELTDL